MGASSNSGGDYQEWVSHNTHYDHTGSFYDPQVYNEIVHGDSEDITFGLYNEICVGAYIDLTIGILLEIVVGPMLELCGGGLFEMTGLPRGVLRTWTEDFDSTAAKTLPLAAQYDLVTGSYLENIYNGSMYYWQAALEDSADDPGSFTVKGVAYTNGDTLAETRVAGNHAEVVARKCVRAAAGIGYVAPESPITIVGESVVLQGTAATQLCANSGSLQAQGDMTQIAATEQCQMTATYAMMTLQAASFAVQSNGDLTLPAPLNEWGQPPVAAPPVAAAAEEDDLPDEEFFDAVEPPSDDEDDEDEFFDAREE